MLKLNVMRDTSARRSLSVLCFLGSLYFIALNLIGIPYKMVYVESYSPLIAERARIAHIATYIDSAYIQRQSLPDSLNVRVESLGVDVPPSEHPSVVNPSYITYDRIDSLTFKITTFSHAQPLIAKYSTLHLRNTCSYVLHNEGKPGVGLAMLASHPVMDHIRTTQDALALPIIATTFACSAILFALGTYFLIARPRGSQTSTSITSDGAHR